MARLTPPLSPNLPMVDPDTGQPTPFFLRWWQDQIDSNTLITDLSTAEAVSAVLDLFTEGWGNILYRGETLWQSLPAGTADDYLQTKGANADPVWASIATTFLALTDTPSAYTGQAGKAVTVNLAEDGLEFTDAATGGGAEGVVNTITEIDAATGTSATNVNYAITVTTDPSTNDDIWHITIVGQVSGTPTGMTFDGVAADSVSIRKLGSFDFAISAVFSGISGTGVKNTALLGSLGTIYRSTIIAAQLRNADVDTVQFDSSTSNTAAGSLSLTPARAGAYAAGIYTIDDTIAGDVGGTLVTDGAEERADTVVELNFRSQAHVQEGVAADTAATYTFGEDGGGDDRTIGIMVMMEPTLDILLADLLDVSTATPADNNVLTWDAATGLWTPEAPAATISSIGDLSDVDITTVAPTDGQVLKWVAADSEFQPADDDDSGGGGAVPSSPAQGFRVAKLLANQAVALGGAFKRVTFDSTVFEDVTGWDDPNDEYVVPAELDGALMGFVGNFAATASPNVNMELDHTDSAGTRKNVARQEKTGEQYNVTLAPVKVATGDKIFLNCRFNSVAGTVQSGLQTTLGGFVVPGTIGSNAEFKGFRAIASATQAISGSTFTEIVFGTEVFDPDGVFASNRFTVPADWDGLYGEITCGMYIAAAAQGAIYLQVDTGGGFVTIGQSTNYGTSIVVGRSLSSGPILFNTGDVYRVACFEASAETIANSPRTFFSGNVVGKVANPVYRSLYYATVYITSNQTGIDATSGAGAQAIDWDAVVSSGGFTWWSGTNADRLTVPVGSGITQVRLSASVTWQDLLSSNDVRIYVFKNGAIFDFFTNDRNEVNSGVPTSQLTTPILDVAEGDYFQLYISVEGSDTSVGISSGNRRTWFAMEEVPLVATDS